MNIKRHTVLFPAAVALAAATLVTACGSSGTISPASSAKPATTKSAQQVSDPEVTQREDSNWAGYAVASSKTKNVSFSSVSGDWTQPAVNCSAGSPSDSAFWVGLGGYTGEHLEQIGTSADCSADGQAVYSAWYELVPAAEVAVSMTVEPGDQFSARVAVSGQTVTLSISDLTQNTTVSRKLHMSSPTVSSAEWIAEAPSECDSSSAQDCRILPLADFGSVRFTDADASAAGRSGSITSGLGSVEALTLEANPGFGRMFVASAQADATAEPLSGSGASFSVNWVQPQPQVPAPTVVVVASGPFFH
jgi:Peptidase A4 family